MQDFDGVQWNYFTAWVQGGNNVFLYPGEGGYDWDEVHAYVLKCALDNTKRSPECAKILTERLGTAEPFTGLSVVYPHDSLGQRFVAIYAHEDGDNINELAWNVFQTQQADMYDSLGIQGAYTVRIPDVKDQVEETLGRIELRIALLHEEAGFPRVAPVLYPTDLKLVALYDAVEENFEAVKALALSPLSSEEVKHEACYLTYSIAAHLRMDLYARAKADNVPSKGDPAISWSSKTRTSKGW